MKRWCAVRAASGSQQGAFLLRPHMVEGTKQLCQVSVCLSVHLLTKSLAM
jgi:hypothetical protein